MTVVKRAARAKRRAKSMRLRRWQHLEHTASKFGYMSDWRGAITVNGKNVRVTPGQMMSLKRRARFKEAL